MILRAPAFHRRYRTFLLVIACATCALFTVSFPALGAQVEVQGANLLITGQDGDRFNDESFVWLDDGTMATMAAADGVTLPPAPLIVDGELLSGHLAVGAGCVAFGRHGYAACPSRGVSRIVADLTRGCGDFRMDSALSTPLGATVSRSYSATGGAGADAFTIVASATGSCTSAHVDGGDGNDTITAAQRPAQRDDIVCGGGTDIVRTDSLDVLSASDCESVNPTSDGGGGGSTTTTTTATTTSSTDTPPATTSSTTPSDATTDDQTADSSGDDSSAPTDDTLPAVDACTNLAGAQQRVPNGFTALQTMCVGSRGVDRLRGTAGRDVIHAAGSADVLIGGGGADVLYGDAGGDSIIGGGGRDVLVGGAGSDYINALDQAGGDTVVCGAGNRDVARIDRGDRATGCERVLRR